MVSLGGIPCDGGMNWDNLAALDESPLRTFDGDAEATIIARIDEAKKAGDTLGGVVEARFRGLPVGLGSHTQWDRKLDGRFGAGRDEYSGHQRGGDRRRLGGRHEGRLERPRRHLSQRRGLLPRDQPGGGLRGGALPTAKSWCCGPR